MTRPIGSRSALWVVALVFVAGAGFGRGAGAQEDDVALFLPVAWRVAERAGLPLPPALPTVTPTATASATATVTATPEASPTTAAPSRIHGLMVVDGVPLPRRFGLPGTPQIELRRLVAGEWETVANAVTQVGGVFEFENPPPLGPGEVYQVWWLNDPENLGIGRYVRRWWSRRISSFGPGDDEDVGVFELAEIQLLEPCHDCHLSLPVTYKWRPRDFEETYRWALYKGCGDIALRENAWTTQSLGHASELVVSRPPPSFRVEELYCWFIIADAGPNGTGWSFEDWRTLWLVP